jgi:hypothetical protein
MFFSFSSAMVMIHLNPCTKNDSLVSAGDFQRRVFREDKTQQFRGGRTGLLLSSPPLCLSKIFRLRQNFLPLRACDPVQHTVHRFLDSGAGPVELPRGLGGELT